MNMYYKVLVLTLFLARLFIILFQAAVKLPGQSNKDWLFFAILTIIFSVESVQARGTSIAALARSPACTKGPGEA